MLSRRLSARLNHLLRHSPADYRTSSGTEVDLVLTLPGGKLWAIEVKRSSAPRIERGFHSACADLDPRKRFVVYPGTERFPLDDITDAIGKVVPSTWEWCGREDLNLHGIAPAATSRQCVCQFRHDRVSTATKTDVYD